MSAIFFKFMFCRSALALLCVDSRPVLVSIVTVVQLYDLVALWVVWLNKGDKDENGCCGESKVLTKITTEKGR